MDTKGKYTNVVLNCGPTKTKLKLTSKVAKGGEGEIYNLNVINSASSAHIGKKYVAKIYLENNHQYREKIQYMIRYANSYDKSDQHKFYKNFDGTILWPLCALDNNGNFMGYTMKLFTGEKLSSFIKVPLDVVTTKYFVGWKKIDLVRLALGIAQKVNFLHKNNIILGDLDLDNIMVDLKQKKTAIVDTDSFQIGNFFCNVAHWDSAPPEVHYLQKTGEIRKTKRTTNSDNFSLAVVIFEILMLGYHPYQYKNGNNNRSVDIDNGNFRYPYRVYDEKSISLIPSKDIAAIWSHLPYYIRSNFVNTFSRGGYNFKSTNRLSANAWINDLERYIKDLSSGNYLKFDQEGNSIAPRKVKFENKI